MVDGIPAFNGIESFVDFTTQGLRLQIATEEGRFDHLPELRKRLIDGMLQSCASEAPQDRLRFGCPQTQGSGIFDHLVILLANEVPVNRTSENQLQVGVGIRITCLWAIQLLRIDVL